MTALSSPTADFAGLVAQMVAEELRPDVARLLVPNADDVLAGVDAIAEHMGLSERFVRDHMGRDIPGRKLGTKWVASKAALTEWLACRDP